MTKEPLVYAREICDCKCGRRYFGPCVMAVCSGCYGITDINRTKFYHYKEYGKGNICINERKLNDPRGVCSSPPIQMPGLRLKDDVE